MILGRRLVVPVVLLAVTAMLAACQTPPPPAGSARSCSVGIVGDSLTVGSQPYWNKAFGERGCKVQFVNAWSGRPTADGVQAIERLVQLGWLPDILVVALGTNDSVHPGKFGGQVERVMSLVRDRPVVWVNLDKPWVEHTLNFALRTVDARYSNLHVYDWNSFADSYPQIRLWDRIHLTDGGYNLRAHMIANFVSGR